MGRGDGSGRRGRPRMGERAVVAPMLFPTREHTAVANSRSPSFMSGTRRRSPAAPLQARVSRILSADAAVGVSGGGGGGCRVGARTRKPAPRAGGVNASTAGGG